MALSPFGRYWPYSGKANAEKGRGRAAETEF
jgi:hypothetical protein